MKRIRFLALLLALAMVFSLAACGSADNTSSQEDQNLGEGVSEEEASSDTSEEETEYVVPAEALEDIVSYLTDGVYTSDTVVATVGSIDVTMDQVLYWISYEQYSRVTYYNYYASYYGGSTVSMTDDYDDTMTVGEFIAKMGAEDAIMYAAVADQAKNLGVELNEEDAAAIETLDEDTIAYYGDYLWDTAVSNGDISEADFTEAEKEEWMQTYGAAYYANYLAFNSTTAEAMKLMYTYYYLYTELENHMYGEGGDLEPTEEDLLGYISDNGILWARCILLDTTECEDDDELAEVEAQAQALYDELDALTGDAQADRFVELQGEYDTSGYNAGDVAIYTNSDSLIDGYYDAIAELEIGELGLTCLDGYGYFILLREEEVLDDVQEEYISDSFVALVERWMENYGATCDLTELDLNNYYTKLEELQTIIANVNYG